jgi:hypothetical protein
MARTRSYVTRNLVRRCRAAGPAFNTRGVFRRPLIRPIDSSMRVAARRRAALSYDLNYFTEPDQTPAEPKPDLAPIRDVIADQLALIRGSQGAEREQRIVAMLLFLTANVDLLRSNQVQLNAYKRIAELYAKEGLFAFAAAFDFLVATA